MHENTESIRFHHAGISVPDLERALTWYCEALGLRPGFRFDIPSAGMRGAYALGDGNNGVELIEMADSVPGVVRADPMSANAVHGYSHVCFLVADLDAAYGRLVAHGAAGLWEPRESVEPGMRIAFAADPDGNLIELTSPASEEQGR